MALRLPLILPALLLWLAPAGLRGQEPEPPPPDTLPPDSVTFQLRDLTVETARPVVTGGGASAVRLRVDSIATVPSPTLAEVLRGMPLVRVRRNSRGQVQPSLRGMEERQIAILMDGVPLTVGWDNRTDLSVVPLTAASEIEMVRGLSSVLAGPNALGGVLKIGITQGVFPERIERPVRARASVDHTGALAFSGEVNHLWTEGEGDVWLRYGGGYRTRDGHAVPGDLPPAGRAADGRILNSDMEYANAFLALRYQRDGGHWISLSSSAFRTSHGVVPELHLLGGDAPEPRFWRYPERWRSVTAVTGGTGWVETALGRGDLEASVGLDVGRTEIDAFTGPDFDVGAGGEVGKDRTVSLRLLGDHELGAGTLSAAATWAETWHEQAVAGEAPEEFEQRLWSVGIETEQPLAPGGVGGPIRDPRLTVGLSYDASSTPRTGDAPPREGIDGWGARAAAELGVGGDARIHGGVSRKVRFPALRELFSGALGKFVPNPDLGPLTLEVAEVGSTLRPAPGVELQGIVFQQSLLGSIVRAVLPGGDLQRQNRGETRARGVEVVANWRRRGIAVRADLTLQDVDLLDDAGEPTGERPEYQPEVSGNLHLRVPVGPALRAWGDLEVVGAQWGVDAEREVDPFVRLSPSAHVEVGVARDLEGGIAGLPPLRASLVVENLGDALVYDQLGLPRPGRTFRLQVESL